MANKQIDVRVINKHDTEENWNSCTYIPLQSEIIIYDIDKNHGFQRFKLGDGKTEVFNLPFLVSNPLFVGTQAEYEDANSKGLIPIGMIVYIIDEDINDDGEDTEDSNDTTSMLGYAILGQMILGNK